MTLNRASYEVNSRRGKSFTCTNERLDGSYFRLDHVGYKSKWESNHRRITLSLFTFLGFGLVSMVENRGLMRKVICQTVEMKTAFLLASQMPTSHL